MRALDKNLTIVSAAERAALYGLPDFDDFQRAEYFDLTTEEHTLLQSRVGLAEQVLCILQIGYFKAKRAFFKFRLADVPPEDIDFLMRRYFPGQTLRRKPVRQAEYYRQRKEILRLFGYRLWSQDFTPLLSERAAQQVRRDVTPAFVLTELIALLRQEKIVRPGYHSLQAVISEALAGNGGVCPKSSRRPWTTMPWPRSNNFWFGRKPCPSWRRSNRTPRTSDTA